MKFLASLSLLLASSIGISAPITHQAAKEYRIQAEKSTAKKVKLRVYNADDYILHDLTEKESLLDEFKQYVWETDGVDIDVIYSTFATNEDMLSRIQTGAAQYDLICPSDYAIQKMVQKGMAEPFAKGEDRKKLYGDRYKGWETDNYEKYASKYLQDYFEEIDCLEPDGKRVPLAKYSKGYMWGTLGLTYNPDYYVFKQRNMSRDQVMYDLSDWTSLWKEEYKGTYQIKDSLRDTYALGLMKSFDPLLSKMKLYYDQGKISEKEYTEQENIVFNNINYLDEFNALDKKYFPDTHKDYTIQSIVDSVQESLAVLKKNCYGLEVDSGKTDIITGNKNGIGLAWSGDAITSLDGGDELSNPVKLYYSVPRTGGNIWFDGWVMQKYDGLNKEYAQKFIDFLCEPKIAMRNMEWIGYTSFVAGPEVRNLVREKYDPRLKEIYVYDETEGAFLKDDDDNLIVKTTKKGVVKEKIDGEEHEIDYGEHDMTGSCLYVPNSDDKDEKEFGYMMIDGEKKPWKDIAEENGWTARDLSYFFNEETFDGVEDKGSHFYSDEIEKYRYVDKDGNVHEGEVGRQFLAQYPSKVDDRSSVLNQIPGLAVMEDYGENNIFVLKMWENFKSGGALNWTIVSILIVEVSIAVSVGIYFAVKKNGSKKLRKKRREENK